MNEKDLSNQCLDQQSVLRYSRQLIMPEVGVVGQTALLNASVLVVGAGGLGCPVIQYLAAAGVGCIGIVDYDEVDISNLHRQILHTEKSIEFGINKVKSAALAARSINSKLNIIEHNVQLCRDNAFKIVKNYDVVVDATDNVPSRYLISDACVLCNKPLVSGSALQWEGQLTVYHYKSPEDAEYGPCYRCLYPKPPPPETVTNCSDGGVMGVVPGIIGSLQALETIKIIIGIGPTCHKKLLIFDGLYCQFSNIKLRGCQRNCVICGVNPRITLEALPDYEQFCQMSATDKCLLLNILPREKRLSVSAYKSHFIDSNALHVLIDVRQPVELEICRLPNSINIPIRTLNYIKAVHHKKFELKNTKLSMEQAKLDILDTSIKEISEKEKGAVNLIVVCKQGNDSQKAVEILSKCVDFSQNVEIKDLIGGIMSYASNVDTSLLKY